MRHLESADVESIRQTVRDLIMGEIVDVSGQRVQCFMFGL